MQKVQVTATVDENQMVKMSAEDYAALDRYVKTLESIVVDIENNAPRVEPLTLEKRNLGQAWSFWVLGQKVNALSKDTE